MSNTSAARTTKARPRASGGPPTRSRYVLHLAQKQIEPGHHEPQGGQSDSSPNPGQKSLIGSQLQTNIDR